MKAVNYCICYVQSVGSHHSSDFLAQILDPTAAQQITRDRADYIV